jgi:hypothetical protein
MVAPEAITEQRERETIHITLSRRFGFAIDQCAYLPFEVPAGAQRIRVTMYGWPKQGLTGQR